MRRTSEALRFDAFNKDKGRPPRQRTDDGMAASPYRAGIRKGLVDRCVSVYPVAAQVQLLLKPSCGRHCECSQSPAGLQQTL
mmetsp:Transcript_13481/g.50195  ORF Transcript_13481/g.50195 Transcript_13481/m.50195 type:complete len:82 (-) Transcript_13481:126-371(-)